MRFNVLAATIVLLTACATAPTDRTVARVDVPVTDAKTKTVSAVLTEPREVAGPMPLVILLSGCGGVGPDAMVFRRVTDDYVPNGIATLSIDSFGPRGLTEVCSRPDLINSSIAWRVTDVIAALDWLATRPELDARHVFLQGYSHGAITALKATEVAQPAQHRVAGVVGYYPYCQPESHPGVPSLILIGSEDDWTPADRCVAIIDKAQLELQVYPKATHAFATPNLHETYLGHKLASDEAATNDSQRRALAMIERLRR